MNSTRKKVLSVIVAMAVLLSAGATGLYAFAQSQSKELPLASGVTSVADLANGAAGKSSTAGKEETVYVLADADGSVRKIIVSEWLKNPAGADELSDYTELEDVKNVKGDEGCRMDDGNMRVWGAGGKDIYYQGTTGKALPVEVTIRYTLDGKAISAQELAGKSGRVTIRFDYVNKQKAVVTIGGKEAEIYVPFIMLTGTILDNARFTNVSVSNGKLINDGNHSVVMGFALPGLQESLAFGGDKLELPDYVEITADVTDFALDTTLTLATNEVFNDLKLEDTDDLDTLKDQIAQLDDASKKLLDGSSSLYDGLDTLLAKSEELIAGIDQLAAGAKLLGNGAQALNGGAQQLQAGIGDALKGLNQLTGNSQTLCEGAKTVFETLLAAADTQLAAAGQSLPGLTIENYQKILQGVIDSLNPADIHDMAYQAALEKVTAAVGAQTDNIRIQVRAAVQAKVLEGVLQAAGMPMTAEQYTQAAAAGQIPQAVQAQVEAAVEAQMGTEAVETQVDAAVKQQIAAAIEQHMNSDAVREQMAAAEKQAADGRVRIQDLLGQLDSYNAFYEGLLRYTAGVQSVQDGVGQLSGGAGQLTQGLGSLTEGAEDLMNGVNTLQSGSGALVDGVSRLKEGAMQLKDGMQAFREQGITKIVDAFDGDIQELTHRLQAIADVSRQYTSFAGSPEGMDGSVKFVYRTDSIG